MAEAAIRLVVGLGNPGEKYARTRHNAGFWFVEELARRHGGQFRAEPKHQGELARVRVNGSAGTSAELWLFKPTTYMNKSGGAIASLSHFYKLPIAATLVAHDELDLPPGVARLKWAGGHGGHNGLRDSIAAVGADFWRLRLGIGHPGHKDQVLDYVLQRASAADEQHINEAILKSADLLPMLLFEG
ncbi:MAG: aminoacyl-tRNA hydrolase, partial [Pseudomonadota bacterium]